MGPDGIAQLLGGGGPGALASAATGMAIVAIIVGELKSVLRPLFARLTQLPAVPPLADGPASNAMTEVTQYAEDPWGLLAILIGIGYAFLVAWSAFAPAWLSDPALTVLYGVAIGVGASRGRDFFVGFVGAAAPPGS